MKAGVFVAASLAGLAAAQPHGHRHHRHRRNAYATTETETDIVTATKAQVVVWVDQNGVPYTTSTVTYATPTPQAASSTAPAASSDASDAVLAQAYETSATTFQTSVAPVPTSTPAETPITTEAPATTETPTPTPTPTTYEPPTTDAPTTVAPTTSSAAPAESSSSSSGSGSGSGQGITYSPYNDDGSCKTQDEVTSDFSKINDYGLVRIYGTDCDQVTTVLTAAKAKGIKLMLGIYDITAVSAEAQTIVDACKDSWDSIDTVSVGNELVNTGKADAATVVSAIGTARGVLEAGGYTGPVVTVDTFNAIIDNPELCQASDYAAANCHAFFNSQVMAANAGSWVKTQAGLVADACNKRVVITESGWPSQGNPNGLAVASVENQQSAISSLKENFPDNIFLFTAFNDLWKTAAADTFYAEQYWGILN